MTESIKYKEYEFLMARIAWWLLNNNKQFKKRESYNGVERETVESQIRKGQGKIQNTTIAEYVECAIEDNKSNLDFLPNYVTGSNGKQYSKSMYVDMAQRVSAYEVKNKQTPNIVYLANPNSSPSNNQYSNLYSQSPLLTSQGASGMGQLTGYSCAANSLQQMFFELTGKNISESTIMGWAGTTTAGTSHNGIETAIAKFNKTYGYNLKVEWKNFSDLGNTLSARFKALGELMCQSNKAVFVHLLYRSKWGHYEVPRTVNTSNSALQILNSLGTQGSNGYYGYIENRSFNEQAKYIAGISQKGICIISR
ncbi:MAG: hypothetical protein Q4P18_07330 [Methanobrevibacter sp.]|uniref:hypothetical protein n=1 Tax=Methanobrevibacter sp. TaxID=66852 RepID=UPI0026DF910D|nr:hypothetical protein [Methanobrevibacter sp.]MDO5849330.1 hypothetical protein [Methanobrevibacter sp.]